MPEARAQAVRRAVRDDELELYNEYIGAYSSYRSSVYEDIIGSLGAVNVLEVDSGLGCFATHLLRSRPEGHVIAVEYDGAVLRAAEEAMKREGVRDRWLCVLGDAGELPFGAESFDAVLSTDALHLWPDPVNVLKELQRVMRVGGRVFIHDLSRDANRKILEMVLVSLKSKQSTRGTWFLDHFLRAWRAAYTRDEIERFAREAGFTRFEVTADTAMTHTLRATKT
jgi:demethylmenaquinone methyltransferase/2-methoxy-6-polyprenyl-1,4-benzoquinol methylase